jgi:hypothetical protein
MLVEAVWDGKNVLIITQDLRSRAGKLDPTMSLKILYGLFMLLCRFSRVEGARFFTLASAFFFCESQCLSAAKRIWAALSSLKSCPIFTGER